MLVPLRWLSEEIWPVALFGLPSFSPRFRKLTLDVGNHESRKIPLMSGDHDWPRHAVFDVHPMAAMLSVERPPIGFAQSREFPPFHAATDIT